MSRLDDYEFGREATQDLIDFKDQVREVWNNSKYQMTVTTTDPPNWASNPGEFALTLAGGSANLYVAWSTNTIGGTSSWVRLARAAT